MCSIRKFHDPIILLLIPYLIYLFERKIKGAVRRSKNEYRNRISHNMEEELKKEMVVNLIRAQKTNG